MPRFRQLGQLEANAMATRYAPLPAIRMYALVHDLGVRIAFVFLVLWPFVVAWFVLRFVLRVIF